VSDEEFRALERAVLETPDDAMACARLERLRARMPCEACSGSGEMSRTVPVKGLVATTLLSQKFPCPRCRPLEFSRFRCPAFAAWEAEGRRAADLEAVADMPPGAEQDRILEQLVEDEGWAVRGREEQARAERENADMLALYLERTHLVRLGFSFDDSRWLAAEALREGRLGRR
jgi:hypothetical protein